MMPRMPAQCILAALAVAFLAAAGLRWARSDQRRPDSATRTWLLIALIFTAVAAWLQWHTSLGEIANMPHGMNTPCEFVRAHTGTEPSGADS